MIFIGVCQTATDRLSHLSCNVQANRESVSVPENARKSTKIKSIVPDLSEKIMACMVLCVVSRLCSHDRVDSVDLRSCPVLSLRSWLLANVPRKAP